MTLQDMLKDYLSTSGKSMRSLSLEAGHNSKAVSEMLRLKGMKSKRVTPIALEQATGLDLRDLASGKLMTYGELIVQLKAIAPADSASVNSQRFAMRLLMQKANWVAETRTIFRHDVVAFFESIHPATVNLSNASFATYKSETLKTVDNVAGRDRKRGIVDISGFYQDVCQMIGESDLLFYQKNGSGPFFVFSHERGMKPSEISTGVLQAYFEHRIDISVKGESNAKRQTREMSTLLKALSGKADFASLGFVAVEHPFCDGRDRFSVPDAVFLL